MRFDRAGQGAVNSGRAVAAKSTRAVALCAMTRPSSSSDDGAVGDPSVGKLLRDELAGLRSCPVGRFRIIYRAADLEARAA